jgi:hypothetical protein
MEGVKWEVKRRRRGRMVVDVRKLTARMTSAMSRAAVEDFERKMPGCIGRQGEIWWLLRGRCSSGVMEDVVQRGGPEAEG